MKYYFIKKNGTDTLDLIFAGWGMDQYPFMNEQTDHDLCICFHYNPLTLDMNIFTSYKYIRLTAWSMGVWAAAKIFSKIRLPFVYKIAINGTNTPVDNFSGIPVNIFEATLQTLSTENLDRFYRRMCGSVKQKRSFDSVRPKRTVSSLKAELHYMYDQIKSNEDVYFSWDLAIIGMDDRIFPPENQLRSWNNVPQLLTNEPHLPQCFLKYINDADA